MIPFAVGYHVDDDDELPPPNKILPVPTILVDDFVYAPVIDMSYTGAPDA